MASEFRYDRSDKPALLRQVASSLSHDLRTPIRHSGQFLDLYEKDLAAGKSDTAETHLSVVKESIAQTLDMVSAIVSYTRLGMTLNAPTALDLKDTANAARDRVLLANPSANITISFEGDANYSGHAHLLGELFYELIHNAAQFVPADRPAELHIKSRKLDKEHYLIISDNGEGLPLEYGELVFDLSRKPTRARHPKDWVWD